MSTHCVIAERTDEGYRGIYCHHDGYPEGVGAMLAKHYRDPEKVGKLMELGDISSLEPELEPPPGSSHSHQDPMPGVTVAYGRDRGEAGNRAAQASSLDELVALVSWAHVYLFMGGWWECKGIDHRGYNAHRLDEDERMVSVSESRLEFFVPKFFIPPELGALHGGLKDVSADEFEEMCGRAPVQDDLERANCSEAGKPGHSMCGVCERCSKPRFECGHALA